MSQVPDSLVVRLAPATFVVLWSTGFIGAKYGLPYAEPLTFLALRMGFVVLVFLVIVAIVRPKWLTAQEWMHSAVAGSLVHVTYLGGVFVAISLGIPSGISALIPGLQPILTATIANRFMGERVSPLQWFGLVMGLVGVALVLQDRHVMSGATAAGWIAAFISLFGITLGSLYQKRYCSAIDWRAGNLAQYIQRGFCSGRRARLRNTRHELAAAIHARAGLDGDRDVGRGDRPDVLADPAHAGGKGRKPVLSRAGRDGADGIRSV